MVKEGAKCRVCYKKIKAKRFAEFGPFCEKHFFYYEFIVGRAKVEAQEKFRKKLYRPDKD